MHENKQKTSKNLFERELERGRGKIILRGKSRVGGNGGMGYSAAWGHYSLKDVQG